MRQMRQTIKTSYPSLSAVGRRPARQHHRLGVQGLVRARLQPDAGHVAVHGDHLQPGGRHGGEHGGQRVVAVRLAAGATGATAALRARRRR